jgi:hypothetical protein
MNASIAGNRAKVLSNVSNQNNVCPIVEESDIAVSVRLISALQLAGGRRSRARLSETYCQTTIFALEGTRW